MQYAQCLPHQTTADRWRTSSRGGTSVIEQYDTGNTKTGNYLRASYRGRTRTWKCASEGTDCKLGGLAKKTTSHLSKSQCFSMNATISLHAFLRTPCTFASALSCSPHLATRLRKSGTCCAWSCNDGTTRPCFDSDPHRPRFATTAQAASSTAFSFPLPDCGARSGDTTTPRYGRRLWAPSRASH